MEYAFTFHHRATWDVQNRYYLHKIKMLTSPYRFQYCVEQKKTINSR